MIRNFHRKQRLGTVTEINITPLIDLAFSLLIIFMITTPLLEQSIELQLPIETQKAQQSREDLKFQTISIDSKGQYFWGDKNVNMSELSKLLGKLSEVENPPVIDVRADGRIVYQKVVDLMDLLKQNELTKISLDTQVK